MALYTVTDTELGSIADAIRSKIWIGQSLSYPTGFAASLSVNQTAIKDSGALQSFILSNQVFSISNSIVTKICNNRFRNCDLSQANFSNVTQIGEFAFYQCNNLNTVTFAKCTSIGQFAFGNCQQLGAYSFPSCTQIGSQAFYGCIKLSRANFPRCTSVHIAAFQNCYSLTSISFSTTYQSISNATFNSCGFVSVNSTTGFANITSVGSSAFAYCTNLSYVNLSRLAYIGTFAFNGCMSLITVSLSGSFTFIYQGAFGQCSKLASVYISCNSKFTITSNAFSGCTQLRYVSLSRCSMIAKSAFVNCGQITSLYLHGNFVTSLGSYVSSVFGRAPTRVYVPSALWGQYRAAPYWSLYGSIYSFTGY